MKSGQAKVSDRNNLYYGTGRVLHMVGGPFPKVSRSPDADLFTYPLKVRGHRPWKEILCWRVNEPRSRRGWRTVSLGK